MPAPFCMNYYVSDTFIGDGRFVAMSSMITSGVRLGRDYVAGAGSLVTKNVLDHTVVAGNPARVIRRGITMSNRAELTCWVPDYGGTNTD